MHGTLSLVTLPGVWRRLIIDSVSALGKSNQALVLLASICTLANGNAARHMGGHLSRSGGTWENGAKE